MRRISSGIVALVLTSAIAAPAVAEPQQRSDTFEYESASGAHLGVMVTALTSDLRSFYGAPADRGVLIAKVEQGSPAARANLHVGDIVIAVKDNAITGADDLINALDNMDKGVAFPLTVVRDHKQITLQATIGHAKESPTPSS
jgi:S1-C subfamily serine protease